MDFSLNTFKDILNNFLKLTYESENSISENIWGTLLLTNYYQTTDHNENHKTVVCLNPEDFYLIRSKYFLNKIDEVSKFNTSKEYFQKIFDDFLSVYKSLDDLSKENDLKRQLYAYYIALFNNNSWHFWKGKNFGVYLFPIKNKSFFENKVRFQHYKLKWVGADYNYFDDGKSVIVNFYNKILQ